MTLPTILRRKASVTPVVPTPTASEPLPTNAEAERLHVKVFGFFSIEANGNRPVSMVPWLVAFMLAVLLIIGPIVGTLVKAAGVATIAWAEGRQSLEEKPPD